MRYETIEHLKETDFKRLTGVQGKTFGQMLKGSWKRLARMLANNRLSVPPKKNQTRHYSGKKKGHTQKAQVIADRISAQIVPRLLVMEANKI